MTKTGLSELENNDFKQKIFIDYDIYTVILNENDEIIEIVSYTENGDIENEIEQLAQNIISSSKINESFIGNLYFSKYSYAYVNSNNLMIINNTPTNQRLRSELETSVLIFFILEIIIIYMSKRLTDWIIKPAYEALDKQKQFITDASHELKTPIAVIMANAEALENDIEQKWIDNIRSESERMNKLITNLLNLSQLENNEERKLYSMNNLSKIVEKSCLTFESLLYEKKIKFITNIKENIFLKCDDCQIKQVIAILIDNAIKHCESKGEIIVNLKRQKNEIFLEVINKGDEIPKEIQEKIFERFYRADESRNREENRYGLGLAIAKSIVQNHDGKILVSSENGYTTFKIIFKNI